MPSNATRLVASFTDHTIDDAVETIGFGKFQVLIVFVAGLAWVGLVCLNYISFGVVFHVQPETNEL